MVEGSNMEKYFSGEYYNTLDDKGRIAFPAKLRTVLNGDVIWITKGMGNDKSLLIFSPEDWEKTINELKDKLSIYNEKTRWLYRRFISPACEVTIDKNGRIAIPQGLRDHANLKKDCVYLGMSSVIELWDVETFRNEEAGSSSGSMDMFEEIGKLFARCFFYIKFISKFGGGFFLNHVHKPVMLEEVIANLIDDNTRFFLDCTTGEGGHTEAILSRFINITAFCLDRDAEILEAAKKRLSVFGNRFKAINMNFKNAGISSNIFSGTQFDAALIELAISFNHYKKSGRGFSFNVRQKLDMRLDEESVSVYDIINNYSEEELTDIFFKFGEERFARNISRKIAAERAIKPIEFSDDLARIIAGAIPKKYQSRSIHPATRCFQALRIAANSEFENIQKGIPNVLSILRKGGRLGVITFHSLEDRIVKNIFADLYKDCVCPPEVPVCTCGKKREIDWVAKKIMPGENEIMENPPSRSAKLRVVERL